MTKDKTAELLTENNNQTLKIFKDKKGPGSMGEGRMELENREIFGLLSLEIINILNKKIRFKHLHFFSTFRAQGERNQKKNWITSHVFKNNLFNMSKSFGEITLFYYFYPLYLNCCSNIFLYLFIPLHLYVDKNTGIQTTSWELLEKF